MQIFGYDISIALTDEEKDLHRVGIYSYHIQRIPRDSTLRFDQTQIFPYLSICSPSSPELPPLSGEGITKQAHNYSLIRYSRWMDWTSGNDIKDCMRNRGVSPRVQVDVVYTHDGGPLRFAQGNGKIWRREDCD
jgi:hypothetical protein